MSRSIVLAAVLACSAPALAGIDPGGTATFSVASSKSCSGAFRYAARIGNNDIVMLSAAQLFASDHRFVRARVAGRGIIPERATWNALTAMCGAR